MDLTTLARVKTSGVITVTKEDTYLAQVITNISAEIERALNRHVEQISRTEFYDMKSGQTVLSLKGYPVNSITNIWTDALRTFGSDTVVTSTGYANDTTNGILTFDQVGIAEGAQALKITYTGGMATSTANFITAFPDISAAVEEQCLFILNRRNAGGSTSVSARGGSISLPVSPGQFTKHVQDVIKRYRRILL